MKKLTYILAILAITALLLTACKQEGASNQQPQQKTSADTNTPTQQSQQSQQSSQAQQPKITVPADTYKILATDTSDKLIMKYTIDPENKWNVKTATFEMRNFGDSPITPEITFMVGVGSSPTIKKFEYDAIPPGYKMIKQETVDMNVEEEHVYVKATFSEKDNTREIASVNYDYFAK